MFQTFGTFQINVSLWNPSTKAYDSPVLLKSPNDAVTITDYDHPAYYKIDNYDSRFPVVFNAVDIYISNNDYKNYYANIAEAKTFELKRSENSIVTYTILNRNNNYTVSFKKDSKYTVTFNLEKIDSPFRVIKKYVDSEYFHDHFIVKCAQGIKSCKVKITLSDYDKYLTDNDHTIRATLPAKDQIFQFTQLLLDRSPISASTRRANTIFFVIVGIGLIGSITGTIICCNFCACCSRCCCYNFCHCRKDSSQSSAPRTFGTALV